MGNAATYPLDTVKVTEKMGDDQSFSQIIEPLYAKLTKPSLFFQRLRGGIQSKQTAPSKRELGRPRLQLKLLELQRFSINGGSRFRQLAYI
jgi:hypothetical protein